jgi:hypothetical protein
MTAYYGGALARDFSPGGPTGPGIPIIIEIGKLDDLNTQAAGWDRGHQGRWIAEQSAERIKKTMGAAGDTYLPLAQLYLWAGFGNRSLGENFCTAIFASGAPEPNAKYFERAVEHFTNAARIAGNLRDNQLRMAAIAGRAAAHVFLGNWTQAETDAREIPFNFVYSAQFTGRGPPDLGNDGERWAITMQMIPTYRGITYWGHPFEDYFKRTGDVRAAWGYDSSARYNTAPVANGAWGRFIPHYYPLKYMAPRYADETTRYAFEPNAMYLVPVNLATGREMVLIRAEAALRRNQMTEAMTLINEVRRNTRTYQAGGTIPLATAATMDEAWAALKFERLIEFSLEGRRFGDRRRWRETRTPGAINPLEYLPDNHVQRFGVPRDPPLCFPVPRSEKERNRNVPLDFKG